MVAVYLGVTEEERIENMSYVFFEDVLKELGYRLNYEAVVNYAGNAFAENSWSMISDSNPFNAGEDNAQKKINNSIANFIANSNVQIGKVQMPEGKKVNTEIVKMKEEG